MLSPRAKEVVTQATPSKRVSLILTVRPDAELADVSEIEDRKDRLSMLLKLYSRKKQPLLDHFSPYERAGLRVVDQLVGTPNLIVSAPARVWRRAIRERPKFFADPFVEVKANEPEFVAL